MLTMTDTEKALAVVLDARVVTGTGGGPDKTILLSPRKLLPLGYRNLCVYLHPPEDPGFDELRKRAARYDAPLFEVPDRGAWDLSIVPALLRVCRQEKVQIWHGHDYKTNALGLLLKRFWPMRLVTTVHGWVRHTARTPLYYRIDKFCLPRYEAVIGVSQDLVEASIECGVARDRAILIENGVDAEEFQRRTSVTLAKEKQGWPTHRLLVGAVGRLSPEKGFDLLIRAMGLLVAEGLDVGLFIAGSGPEQRVLEELTQSLGLADRVRFLGYRDDTREIYEALDVFCLSSLREGLPNVLLEAMALETPVAATRVSGVPRLVQHEASGLLVEPGSEKALAGALGRLLRDPALRERLARAGRQTIEERYSFDVRTQKVRDVYDRLLAVKD